MPDDQERIDRLNRALERLVAGQPVPVLKENELDELLRLADQLRRGLPRDTPDPGFIAELRDEILHPHPRLVRLPPRSRPRKYPVGVFASVLGVVLIATVSVGVLAISGKAGRGNLLATDLPLLGGTPTASLSAQFASMPPPTATADTSAMAADTSAPATNTDAPTPPEASEPEPDVAATATSTDAPPAETPSPTATTAPAPSESTPTATESEPTTQLLGMELPPVDDAHVEQGPLATAEPGSAPVPDDVRFALATALPDLDESATVYHLSTPHVDPQWLLERIAQSLGIQGEIVSDTNTADGRETYELSDGASVVFSWTPESGAFACSLPVPPEAGEAVADIAAQALDWLRSLGYPLDPENTRPIVTEISPGSWRVEVPLSELPNPAVGHPLNVSLTLNSQGQVLNASGYWVKVSQIMDVPLMSAEEAWQALRAGHGYWPAGAQPTGPGEFVVESFGVSYILTLDDIGELVLQPVVSAAGAFYADDGSTIPDLTVLIQAAAQTAS
jgi:hypothetical protein